MSRTVLIVDDSSSIRVLWRSALELDGYVVVEAQDGGEAMARVNIDEPSLIITDLSMPRVDGMTLLRQLRSHPRHKGVPVLVASTETRMAVKESARRAGANAYLNKPCTPTQLMSAVRKLCPLPAEAALPAAASTSRS